MPVGESRHCVPMPAHLKTLRQVNSAAVVLEIGCGQDEFTLMLAGAFPQAEARGVDMSAEGIERAVPPAHARKLPADFARRDLLQKETRNEDQRGLAFAVYSEFLKVTSDTALRFLDRVFRYNLDSSPFGWQLLAVARRSEPPAS